MLYKRLNALYTENEVIAEEFPFSEYFPLLQQFISNEVELGAEYLSPYRFALSFSKPPKAAIRFFLGLTDSEEILRQYYKYQCDECDAINIIKDEKALVNFKCKRCGFEDYLETSDYLSEVKLMFKIEDKLLEAVNDNLKINPLSSINTISSAVTDERGDLENVNFNTAEELIIKDGKMISKVSFERSKRIRKYRNLL
ncbi:hypothetical protein [Halobacillus sp. Marseille-Q1614]|uniref:hypothetical protein n=1 Tax=Halobacillus sp. Marseille-Q1614 TaxID=2709134 RepID=UPI00156FBEB1|nr:hypothetical protein [Halobacillus sp. Marseille-Q1614]